ncbi:10355_t:CDS:2, partial [Funneliformis caledonium]
PYEKVDFYAGKFKRLLKKVNSSSALSDKYTVRLFLNRLRKNIVPLVAFNHPKNIEEAIDAAKQVKSDQQDDELEQVLDDYEEKELSEIEAYMANSQEEYELETDLLPLDYNPWNEENH